MKTFGDLEYGDLFVFAGFYPANDEFEEDKWQGYTIYRKCTRKGSKRGYYSLPESKSRCLIDDCCTVKKVIVEDDDYQVKR